MVCSQEIICNIQAEESKSLKASCEADLAEALPALESAVSALKSLSKGDIVEVNFIVFDKTGIPTPLHSLALTGRIFAHL